MMKRNYDDIELQELFLENVIKRLDESPIIYLLNYQNKVTNSKNGFLYMTWEDGVFATNYYVKGDVLDYGMKFHQHEYLCKHLGEINETFNLYYSIVIKSTDMRCNLKCVVSDVAMESIIKQYEKESGKKYS